MSQRMGHVFFKIGPNPHVVGFYLLTHDIGPILKDIACVFRSFGMESVVKAQKHKKSGRKISCSMAQVIGPVKFSVDKPVNYENLADFRRLYVRWYISKI